MSEIQSIDAVRRDAQSAAQALQPVTACPFPPGGVAASLWLIEYTKEINRAQRARIKQEREPCDD